MCNAVILKHFQYDIRKDITTNNDIIYKAEGRKSYAVL